MVQTDLVDTDDEINFDDSNIIADSDSNIPVQKSPNDDSNIIADYDNNIPVQKSPNDMTSVTGKYRFNYIYIIKVFLKCMLLTNYFVCC